MNIHLKGGRLIDPATGADTQADLFIMAGKIAGIASMPAGFHADRTFEASGLIVIPGLIDLSARLSASGYVSKAALAREMAAALAGGVTSLVCPPDTAPPLDEPARVEMLKLCASKLNQARLYPLGALTVGLNGNTLSSMAALSEAGCVGFSQADAPIADTQVLLRALQYAATYHYPVFLRAQEAYLAKGGVMASGALAARLGLAGIPVAAETVALYTIIELMRATGARVHLSHLSTAAGIELVRLAKQEGLPLSCDVTINHLHLTDLDIGHFDTQCRLNPPLRSGRDRDAIRAALADGTIDAICSAHTPRNDDEKRLPFGEAPAGAIGLELLLSLTVKWAQEMRIPLARALAKISCAPADVLHLSAGRIELGAPADLALFDPGAHWMVEPHALSSQGRNTPFLGFELPARVRATIVAGRIAFGSS